jgi:uncharacterized cupin superfamily protein
MISALVSFAVITKPKLYIFAHKTRFCIKNMLKVSVNTLSADEKNKLGISTWPIWEKEISCFDYEYDEEELCYFLEGRVVIRTASQNLEIGPYDFVCFPKGLKCTWDIKEAVRKHYLFPKS